jgi:hypothetical protein
MLSMLYCRINGKENRTSVRLVKIRRDRGAFFAGVQSAVYRVDNGGSVLGYVCRQGDSWQALTRQGEVVAYAKTFAGLKRVLGVL